MISQVNCKGVLVWLRHLLVSYLTESSRIETSPSKPKSLWIKLYAYPYSCTEVSLQGRQGSRDQTDLRVTYHNSTSLLPSSHYHPDNPVEDDRQDTCLATNTTKNTFNKLRQRRLCVSLTMSFSIVGLFIQSNFKVQVLGSFRGATGMRHITRNRRII